MFEVVDDHVNENLGALVLASQGGQFTLHRLVVENDLADVTRVLSTIMRDRDFSSVESDYGKSS